jgi:hypothetical protein
MLGGVHYNWLMYDVGGAVGISVFCFVFCIGYSLIREILL